MAIGTPTSIGVGSFTGTVSGSSLTMTTSAAITAGNLVVLVVAMGSNSTPTVSSISDGTNSYTKAFGITGGASTAILEIWYKANASAVGSGATVTVTLSGAMSGSSEGWVVQGYQVSGIDLTSPLDKTNTVTTNSTTPSTSSGTLTVPNEIIFGASYNNNGARTYTTASGFTSLLTPIGSFGRSLGIDYKIVASTSTVTYQPTWDNTAAVWLGTGQASFKWTPSVAFGNLAMMGM